MSDPGCAEGPFADGLSRDSDNLRFVILDGTSVDLERLHAADPPRAELRDVGEVLDRGEV